MSRTISWSRGLHGSEWYESQGANQSDVNAELVKAQGIMSEGQHAALLDSWGKSLGKRDTTPLLVALGNLERDEAGKTSISEFCEHLRQLAMNMKWSRPSSPARTAGESIVPSEAPRPSDAPSASPSTAPWLPKPGFKRQRIASERPAKRVYSMDAGAIFNDLPQGDRPVINHWNELLGTREGILPGINALLQNVATVLRVAEQHPRSNVGRMVEDLRLRERFLVPRKAHMELLEGILHVCDGYTRGREVPSWETRLIVGPKGIGKSLLLKTITIGVALSLGPRKTLPGDGRTCRVIAGYCPSPARGTLMCPTQLAYMVLREHGLLNEVGEGSWGQRPRDADDAMGCAAEMCWWLRDNQIRLLLILDEFDEVYQNSEADNCVAQLATLRDMSLPVMLWLSGSAGSLRMLVYGKALRGTPEDVSTKNAFQLKYPGYSGVSLNDSKFPAIELRNALRFYQSARVFVHNPFIHDGLRAHHKRVVRFLVEHADEEAEEMREEGVSADGLLPSFSAMRGAAAGGAAEALDDRVDEAMRTTGGDRSVTSGGDRESDPPSANTAIMSASDHDVREWLRIMYWNSCGLGRYYEQLRDVSDENEAVIQLRADIARDAKLRAIVRELASRVEQTAPEVLNPMKSFGIDLEKLSFPLREVLDAVRRQPEGVASSSDIALWADLPYLYVEGSSYAYCIGFAHPAYAAVAILCKREELQRLTTMQHAAFMFPLGHLGQGFPEQMALEAMAIAGMSTAMARAMEYESHTESRLGGLPASVEFSFEAGSTIDLRDPESWGQPLLQRIQSGDPLVIPLKKQQFGADAAAFWSTTDAAGASMRNIALVQAKLVCLYDLEAPYERKRDHTALGIGEIRDKLHFAWLDWGPRICDALGYEEVDVIPWFIVVTSNKVGDKKKASEILSGREPLSAEEMARTEQKKAANGKTMTERERRLANARISGVGCALDQEDMHDAWPAKIKALAEVMNYWPEYMRAPPEALIGERWEDAMAAGGGM